VETRVGATVGGGGKRAEAGRAFPGTSLPGRGAGAARWPRRGAAASFRAETRRFGRSIAAGGADLRVCARAREVDRGLQRERLPVAAGGGGGAERAERGGLEERGGGGRVGAQAEDEVESEGLVRAHAENSGDLHESHSHRQVCSRWARGARGESHHVTEPRCLEHGAAGSRFCGKVGERVHREVLVGPRLLGLSFHQDCHERLRRAALDEVRADKRY
jgi:hypothetical protein